MVSIFDQGDIIEVNLDPTLGHEPQKMGPVLVISASDFNMRSSLTVVAPITSINNGYPMHVCLSGDESAKGYVCVEQLRAIDLIARKTTYIGTASPETMDAVLTRVGAVFGI